ncbi:MAG TPA: response regulator [Gemmatimonadaceae bacterium]|nr:response regulator [Gemmatimonadaceae bacterium]
MTNVLYVDDDPGLSRLVHRWFERRGITIVTATSFAEARKMLKAHDVIGAFIDVWLGDGTGFDLYAWIAEHRPRLRDRVVFITGDIIPAVGQASEVQALGRTVIGKPFELADLERHVRRWTEHPPRRKSDQRPHA